ncbi:MAG TPA: WxL domain-containing protein [Thermoleophilaceae bacterium]|nr:WxL domain-containing protein [Thermoleophilaceae bacterium]
MTPAAQAALDDTSISLLAGTLDYTTPFTADNFPATSLTGLPQAVHATVNPWVVTDSRGSLIAGWNMTISATQFTTGGGSPNTLPAGSMTMATTPVPSTTFGNISLPPTPVAAAAALDGGAAQKIATSAIAQGLGRWTFTPVNLLGGDLTLNVPASAAAGTYTSTITTTLATGP